jgi:hypothetical protein
MAHDRGVAEQPLDVPGAEPRDGLEVEAGERAPEALPLAQDRQPGEPGLEALEAELLEQPAVVVDREAPFGVVVRPVLLGRVAPAAPDDPVVSCRQAVRQGSLPR